MLHPDVGKVVPGDIADRAVLNRSFKVATWDAREWLARLIGCDRGELSVRSIDRYGPKETQVRYERGGEVVARLIVAGPVKPMGTLAGHGHWLASVRIGTGSDDVHSMDVPETDEIVY